MPRRVLKGVVVSNKCDKTVTVKVVKRVKDPLYKKIVSVTKKYAAHDETNSCSLLDNVSIRECRPISKNKKWEIIK